MRKRNLVSLWILGCVSCAGFPRIHELRVIETDTDTQQLIASLEGIARGTKPCEELVMESTEGGWPDGVLQIQVAKGRVRVTHQVGPSEETTYDGLLMEAECRQLVRTAVGRRLWTLESERQVGFPDENHVSIGLGVWGVGVTHVSLWEAEASESKAFSRVISQLAAISKRVTGGQWGY